MLSVFTPRRSILLYSITFVILHDKKKNPEELLSSGILL
jgi:hypothetical protein